MDVMSTNIFIYQEYFSLGTTSCEYFKCKWKKKKYTKIYNPILVLIDHKELNLIGNYKKGGRWWQFPTI